MAQHFRDWIHWWTTTEAAPAFKEAEGEQQPHQFKCMHVIGHMWQAGWSAGNWGARDSSSTSSNWIDCRQDSMSICSHNSVKSVAGALKQITLIDDWHFVAKWVRAGVWAAIHSAPNANVRLSVPLPVRSSVCQSPKSQPQLNEKQRLQRALNCVDCFGVALLMLLLGNLSCVLLYCSNTWISTRGQIGGEPLTALVNADDRRQTRAWKVAALVAIKPAVNRINIASWQRTQLIKPAQPIFIVMAD